VAGLPLIVVAGVVATVFVGFIVYRAAVDPTYGANTTFSYVMNAAVFVIAFVWFFAARAYRRSRGVDIDRRFKEIPVE
jgi:hypothetical protein